MRATALIVPELPALHPSDPGELALLWMAEFHVTHLPVVENNRLLGLISEENILESNAQDLPIGNISLTASGAFVKEQEHIFEVLKIATESRVTIVPVINEHEDYIGSITREQLLRFLTTELGLLEPGGMIVLEFAMNDYNLSDVARIIEQNNGKIICTFANSDAEANKVELTIKINQINLQPFIAHFNRYNFTIVEVYQQPEYFKDLRERYDALMNYLNI